VPVGTLCHLKPVPPLEADSDPGAGRRARRCGIDGLRERKRAATRAGTVDAALDLFVARGYDEVTVADICEAAGIAPRTFFRYFTGKDDVLAEPVREMTALVETAIDRDDGDLTPRALIRAAFLQAATYTVENRNRLAAFITVLHGTARGQAQLSVMPEQERRMARRLAQRTGVSAEQADADWRLRLLVATSITTFRIWQEQFLKGAWPDPIPALEEMLDAVTIQGPRTPS
jgi:AcrR family transcriptional regulator